MSTACMILGESGTGKSTSLRNMSPENVLLIQAIRKPLPFKSNSWRPVSDKGNIIVSDQSDTIITAMRKTRRKIIVIDDFQYMMANEFVRRHEERGFDKFSDIAKHAWDVLTEASNLPGDVRVYILCHTASDDQGKTRAKTIGKMLDDKITVEGMFSIVFRTAVINGRYLFSTRNNGTDTTKTPLGMFDDEFIENDLNAIDSTICEYYQLTNAA